METYRCVCSSSRAHLTPSDWRGKHEDERNKKGLRNGVQSKMMLVYSHLRSREHFSLVNDEGMLSWQWLQLWNIWKRLLRGIKMLLLPGINEMLPSRMGYKVVLAKGAFMTVNVNFCKWEGEWLWPTETWVPHLIHNLILPACAPEFWGVWEGEEIIVVRICVDFCGISREWMVHGTYENCLFIFFCISDLWQWEIKSNSIWKYLHIVSDEHFSLFVCLPSLDKEEAAGCG